MTSSSRSLLLGAALLAFVPACGSIIEREGDPSDRPSDEDAPDAADPGGVDAEEGEVADDTPGDPDATARSSICPSASFSGGAADAIAVTWDDEAASLVLRDGSLLALDLPTAAPPAEAFASVSVLVGADRVVVSRGWSVYGPTPVAHATIRWFDRRGVMLEELVSDDGLWPSQVGPDGTTVMFRSLGAEHGYVARLADGSLHELEGLDVWGEVLPSGWLRGYDQAAGRAAFLHPTTQERRVLDTLAYPAFVDDGFVHLGGTSASPTLVHVTPDQTVEMPLPAIEGIAFDRLGISPVARSTFALVTDHVAQRAWRLDWTTGELVAIDEATPPGFELLDDACGLSPPMVTSSGEIVAGLRTQGDAQAAVVSVGGGDWRLLGVPYAQPGTFGVTETAGTFVIIAGDQSYAYCPILGWDEPASERAIESDEVQLVRPSAGVAHVLAEVDPWSVLPTRDGGCVTFTRGALDGSGITRTVFDLSGGEPLEIEGDSFAWIP